MTRGDTTVVPEQLSPEVVFDGKEKKKKRRSNRRSRQNPSAVAPACNSVNEVRLEECVSLGFNSISSCLTSNKESMAKASNVAFNSLPIMHVNDEALIQGIGSTENQQMFQSEVGGRIFSSSCPEPISSNQSMGSPPKRVVMCHGHRNYFAPHWSLDAVAWAVESGNVFKALFRVNAHNRLEAYCKIDGVPADVLINGVAAQNRAVEGDIVAIEVDPLEFWTRMKGSTGSSNNFDVVDVSNSLPRYVESFNDNCKGKNKVGPDSEFSKCRNGFLIPENGFHDETCIDHVDDVSTELLGSTGNILVNGNHQFPSDPSWERCSSGQNEDVTAVEKLCDMITSFPAKRPTGRVVAIIEMSPRRDAVVGFLNVKQWVYSRMGYRKDNKKNKLPLLSSNRDHIQLTPTDPKFPKMMVPGRSLPNHIKKRLEGGDVTVEMELVAARIVDWGAEHFSPQAHVTHIFGRGGDVESQIAAILFENTINSSEFSPETVSCLPCLPWEVPGQEFQSRKDIRKLCVFTIDPATATDLDDALSVELLSNGNYRVGVHIADVSYFVLPDTAVDIEAQMRTTSVYLLQRKLPMLPPLLSEDLGSLSPGVDRLAFSIFWDINLTGVVLDRWIGRTIIRSCCKLSYEHAQDIIDGRFEVESCKTSEYGLPLLHGHFEWSDVSKSVKSLHEISKTLKANRFNKGALSLENPKVAFLFDEDGIPYDSIHCGRKESNFLVEEFMLLANWTAAEVITRAYPSSALLRKHPEPNLRKLREFEAFCSKHGLELDTSSSSQIHHSLERIRQQLKNDSVLFDILMSYATKPMQLASYFCSGDSTDTESDWGHYALAIPLYTHFTSPLRRYPDIVVHRTLAATLEAEEMYLRQKRVLEKQNGEKVMERCFTGICFDKHASQLLEAQEALSAAASKHKVPCSEVLTDVAAHCNERKLASRHVKDATHKLYIWALLRKKEILISEARVLGLGPRFMSIFIQKLSIERRIYYDEVEGLEAEWLDATSTLVLSLCTNKSFQRRGSPGKCRALEEVALVIDPYNLMAELDLSGDGHVVAASQTEQECSTSRFSDIEPAFFPLTVHLLSTIPVALHAVGGDDGPLDIGVRLWSSSYF